MTGYLVGFLIRGELHGLGLLSVNKPFLAACAGVHVAPLDSTDCTQGFQKIDWRIFIMTFEEFQDKVKWYAKKAGFCGSIRFEHDVDRKQYSATIPSEELRLTCRESGLGMTAHFHNRTLPVPQGI